MLTFGSKILLQDADSVGLNLCKMKCICKVTICFVCSLLGFHVPASINRRKSVSCMLLLLSGGVGAQRSSQGQQGFISQSFLMSCSVFPCGVTDEGLSACG